MNRLSGYVWEVTSSTGIKRRVITESPNIEEAVSECRRIHGDLEFLAKIKYLKFRREQES